MEHPQTTTISVSIRNRDALLALGRIMQQQHPEIWATTPSLNATIGYALTHDLSAVINELLPTGGEA
jgi:hypothetical protein